MTSILPDRYEVDLTKQAQKDLKGLRPWTAEATRAILELEENLLKGHPLKGSLRGARALEFSLKGSGVYRAVYFVDDSDRICLVFIVGPHENIYEKAERRAEAFRWGTGE